MALSTIQPPSNGGYDLDQFLDIVSRMEGAGLLDDFTKSHPQYLIGIEVARAILQRGRNNNNAATRGLGPPPDASACVPSSGNNCSNGPNVPSVRHFVGLIYQLLEELCPNRSDPNIRSCEDRCLAALQMAVVHCLKLVRQKKIGEPQAAITSGCGFQQSSSSQRAIAYQQFNPPTVGGMSGPPQQGTCGMSQQGQQGGGFPPQQSPYGFAPQQGGGGFAPQQGGGGMPPQQSPCAMAQQTAGGFPPQGGAPQQQPGGFPAQPGVSPCGMSHGQQGGGGFPPQQGAFQQQQQRGGFPPQQGFSPCGMSQGQQGGAGFQQMQLSTGPSRQQSQMMAASLDQRLASIPEPPPCPFGKGDTRPQHTVSSFLQRPPLIGSLEERLAAIPEPPICHMCESGGAPLPPTAGSGSSGCSGGYGFGHRTQGRPEDNGLMVKLFLPAAGGYSDGIGGHKIKGFAGQADTDRDIMSLTARSGNMTAGSLDGVGGRKVKDLED